jgi:hypothetical protein
MKGRWVDACKKANASLKSHIEQMIKRSQAVIQAQKRLAEATEVTIAKKRAKACAEQIKQDALETRPLFKIVVPKLVESKTLIDIPVITGLQLARVPHGSEFNKT